MSSIHQHGNSKNRKNNGCVKQCIGMSSTGDFSDLIEDSNASKPWRDRRILAHLHVAHRLEYAEIADILDCSLTAVSEWSRRLDVKFPWRVKGVLETLYYTHGLSSHSISDRFKTEKSTVLKWMDRMGIERRGVGERVDYPRLHDREWLREKYIEEHLSTHKIAEIIGCDKAAVLYHLERSDIDIRESQSDYSGRLNAKYDGGSDFITAIRNALSGKQSVWRAKAKSVCESKGECYACGDSDEILSAHHLVPVAAGGVNTDELLMPLCQSCHTKADYFTDKYVTRHVVAPIVKNAETTQ